MPQSNDVNPAVELLSLPASELANNPIAKPVFKPTTEQQHVIDAEVSDILVSAAAGSGKTAVMTERIVQRIDLGKLEISQVLVMTFTDAAARQMKAKIAEKLERRRSETTDSVLKQRLQSQQTLLTGAAISTIHAFCLTVVKNFSHLAVDDGGQPLVEPGFATADAGQASLLLKESIDLVLAARYEAIDRESDVTTRPWTTAFMRLVNSYSNSRNDQPLREQLEKLFLYLRSQPNYTQQLSDYRAIIESNRTDFASSKVALVLQNQTRLVLNQAIAGIPEIEDLLTSGIELVKNPAQNRDRIMQFKALFATLKTAHQELTDGTADWNRITSLAQSINMPTLPQNRQTATDEVKQFIMLFRESIAEAIYCLTGKLSSASYRSYYLFDTQWLYQCSAAEIELEIADMQPVLEQLFALVIELDQMYRTQKSKLGLIDFSDFEHLALRILTQPEAWQYYQNRFKEIYIDEYQDTSSIQAAILSAIGQNNIFMVGDVKQSIYRFRHARPQLFIKRTNDYLANSPTRLHTLNQNFRSVPGVLAAVNELFSQLMSIASGELDYDETQALKPKRDAESSGRAPVTLLLLTERDVDATYEHDASAQAETSNEPLDATDPDTDEAADLELVKRPLTDEVDGDLIEPGNLETYQKEAMLVCQSIQNQLASGIQAKDIVILARSRRLVQLFAKTLLAARVDTLEETGQHLLDSPELRLLQALLTMMDNPLQDVPLAAVLRSTLFEGGFTASELISIRIAARQAERQDKLDLKFYHAAVAWYAHTGPDEALRDRISRFLLWTENWRDQEKTLKIGEWLNLLLESTGYFNQVAAAPAGTERLREIRALVDWTYTFERTAQRGLFDLVRYLEKLIESGINESPFAIETSTRNAVRVMTIHHSKGLEFPVVYVVGLNVGLQKSMRQTPLMMSEELGIGFDWIDPDSHQRRITHVKLAMLAENKAAALAEEMRLLYVAMTRAENHLVLSACVTEQNRKNLQKRILQARNQTESVLSAELVLSCKSYLEWIILALARHPQIDLTNLVSYATIATDDAAIVDDFKTSEISEGPTYTLKQPTESAWCLVLTDLQDLLDQIHMQNNPNLLLENHASDETVLSNTATDDRAAAQQLCRLFHANPAVDEAQIATAVQRIGGDYAYPAASRRPIKLSVSELKRIEQQEARLDDEQIIDIDARGINLDLRPLITTAIDDEHLMTGATLGTALHSLLRYVDLNRARQHAVSTNQSETDIHTANSALEDLRKQVEELTAAEVLTTAEGQAVSRYLPDVLAFVNADLAGRMIAADRERKQLYREMPFTLAVPAAMIWPQDDGFAADDLALVQGIIDAWFMENEAAILLDYKSDKILGTPAMIRAELLHRYARQLQYYARAITAATRLSVDEHHIVHLPSRQVYTYSPTEIAESIR
ncbi:MAG: UvrD-helicase domain-containing protein [Eubacteriales bacterium]|nr:UvrD-helicase domain-containing protein [Eubacteriales bacterium]